MVSARTWILCWLCVATLSVAAALAAPEPAPLPKLAPLPTLQGYYHVAGMHEDGTAYEGLVTVERMSTGRYFIRWTLRNQPIYTGVGDLDGDRLWTAYHVAGAVGLARYRVEQKDGKPHMRCDRGAKEEWTWLRGFDKP